MSNYQIIATIESIDLASGVLNLKGVSKYCFEKENGKDKEKEYLNILENVENIENSVLRKQYTPFQINIPTDNLAMQHLLGYAFCEKKRFKWATSSRLMMRFGAARLSPKKRITFIAA